MTQSRKSPNKNEQQLKKLTDKKKELVEEFKKIDELITNTSNQQQQRLGAISLLEEQIEEIEEKK